MNMEISLNLSLIFLSKQFLFQFNVLCFGVFRILRQKTEANK